MRLSSLVAAICVTVLGSAQTDNPLRITTSTGTYLGLINGTAPAVRQFLNIPYGLSTAGPRRFAPPVPIDTTSDVIIDATHFSLSCAQYLGDALSIWNQDVPDFIVDSCDGGCGPGEDGDHVLGAMAGSSGEECLSLALWTPLNATEGSMLPVIVFMTGGG
jgi:carboxylesterase type B